MITCSLVSGYQHSKEPTSSTLSIEPEFRTPQYGHSPPYKFHIMHNVAIRMILFITAESYAAFIRNSRGAVCLLYHKSFPSLRFIFH
jgi:hypothetical protein